MHTCLQSHTPTLTYTLTHTNIHTHAHAHTHKLSYILTLSHTYTKTNTQTQTHILSHTNMCTYTQQQKAKKKKKNQSKPLFHPEETLPLWSQVHSSEVDRAPTEYTRCPKSDSQHHIKLLLALKLTSTGILKFIRQSLSK